MSGVRVQTTELLNLTPGHFTERVVLDRGGLRLSGPIVLLGLLDRYFKTLH